MYTTEAAPINAPKPKHLMNKSAQEIVEYMMKHFKTNYLVGTGQKSLNKSTAYLIAVSDTLFDPQDWKAPFYARFPECGEEWAEAAIIWYHGAEATRSFIGVFSPGYQC